MDNISAITVEDDRLQRTLAECIDLHGIVSVEGIQYIRTDYARRMAYKGRVYLGNPAIPFSRVVKELYSPLENFVDCEQYHLYVIETYTCGAKPRFVGVSEHEINKR